jgi:hypothetical protein
MEERLSFEAYEAIARELAKVIKGRDGEYMAFSVLNFYENVNTRFGVTEDPRVDSLRGELTEIIRKDKEEERK